MTIKNYLLLLYNSFVSIVKSKKTMNTTLDLDLNIHHYTLKDIETFFGLNKQNYSPSDVELKENQMREILLNSGHINKRFKSDIISFLNLAKQQLLEKFKEKKKEKTLIPKNWQLDDFQYPAPNTQVLPNSREEDVLNPPFWSSSSLNPIDKQTTTKHICIDTLFRANHHSTKSTDFMYFLPKTYSNVASLQITSLEFSHIWNTVSSECKNNEMTIYLYNMVGYPDGSHTIILPDGNYNEHTFKTTINNIFNNVGGGLEFLQVDIDPISNSTIFRVKEENDKTNLFKRRKERKLFDDLFDDYMKTFDVSFHFFEFFENNTSFYDDFFNTQKIDLCFSPKTNFVVNKIHFKNVSFHHYTTQDCSINDCSCNTSFIKNSDVSCSFFENAFFKNVSCHKSSFQQNGFFKDCFFDDTSCNECFAKNSTFNNLLENNSNYFVQCIIENNLTCYKSFYKDCSLNKCDFCNFCSLYHNDIFDCSFLSCFFNDCSLNDSSCNSCYFKDCSLNNGLFFDCYFDKCCFNNHNTFHDCYFNNSVFDNTSTFIGDCMTDNHTLEKTPCPFDPNSVYFSPQFRFVVDFTLKHDPERDLYKNLGWMLGFRKKWYDISITNIEHSYVDDPSNVMLYEGFLKSESMYCSSFHNYFFLELDDFHNNFPTDTIISTNSHNSTYLGKNIIARIVISTNHHQNYNNHKTNASDQQFIKREYFGPITLEKVKIRLLNKFGDVIDFHNNDFSFTLEIKQIYS